MISCKKVSKFLSMPEEERSLILNGFFKIHLLKCEKCREFKQDMDQIGMAILKRMNSESSTEIDQQFSYLHQ